MIRVWSALTLSRIFEANTASGGRCDGYSDKLG